jgi:hypothetical protein
MKHVHSTPINTSCYAGVKESYILLQKDAKTVEEKGERIKERHENKKDTICSPHICYANFSIR